VLNMSFPVVCRWRYCCNWIFLCRCVQAMTLIKRLKFGADGTLTFWVTNY